MKKIIAVLAAVLMLCAIIPMGALSVSAADNLVPNGTFDSNTSGWGKSTNTVLTLDNGAMKATHADDWAYVYTWFDVTANTSTPSPSKRRRTRAVLPSTLRIMDGPLPVSPSCPPPSPPSGKSMR